MIKKIITLILDIKAYVLLFFNKPKCNEKAVFVNFKNPQLYHRFFYLLLKFYQLEGYTIYYPMNFATFRNLRNKDNYLALIVRESKFLTIHKPLKKAITLTDNQFSAEYFNSYFERHNEDEACFHIPMSFHPFMYHNSLWNLKVNTDKNRINSIFCYGNFDKKAYLEIEKTNFSVIPRIVILNHLKKMKNFISLENKTQTLELIETKKINQKIVFAEKEKYQIEMKDVREILSNFDFYLCCPGVVMPLCHNVIEAMSVGTIPVIQKEYAEVMYPALKNFTNAIVFNDKDDLVATIEIALQLPEEKKLTMKKSVLEYYSNYLSPKGMTTQLNTALSKNKKIYLQAEHRSVKFLK